MRFHSGLLAIAVAAVLFPNLSTPALAAPIVLDNDVTIDWQDGSPDSISFQVFGAPRLVPNARAVGNLVTLDLDLVLPDDLSPSTDVIHTVDYSLLVGDSSLEEVLVGGSPLVLRYVANEFVNGGGQNLEDWFTLNPGGVISLDRFDNFALLPPGDLVFSVQGRFVGRDSRDLTGRVTMAGPGSLVSVPEPSTLLLFGSAFALLQVVRLRRKNRSVFPEPE